MSALLGAPTLALTVTKLGRADAGAGNFAIVGLSVAVATVLALVVGFAVVEELLIRNSAISVDASRVEVTDWLGRRRAVEIAQLRAIRLGYAVRRSTGQEFRTPTVTFETPDGASAFVIYGKEFAAADLRRVSVAAEIPLLGSWE